jgi:hypothetical protein
MSTISERVQFEQAARDTYLHPLMQFFAQFGLKLLKAYDELDKENAILRKQQVETPPQAPDYQPDPNPCPSIKEPRDAKDVLAWLRYRIDSSLWGAIVKLSEFADEQERRIQNLTLQINKPDPRDGEIEKLKSRVAFYDSRLDILKDHVDSWRAK